MMPVDYDCVEGNIVDIESEYHHFMPSNSTSCIRKYSEKLFMLFSIQCSRNISCPPPPCFAHSKQLSLLSPLDHLPPPIRTMTVGILAFCAILFFSPALITLTFRSTPSDAIFLSNQQTWPTRPLKPVPSCLRVRTASRLFIPRKSRVRDAFSSSHYESSC
ncbi:hypothetical protein K432DRAFT_70944 [Lepidopterella palustris CBS 459.81]|uniref:Transmembrane protein n=1 Tax=Lepidopterella palustris CBS 459.81 TaxID=1314670 RepID=A0A8E2E8T5_9PEZI|nr:hypothetical protein K432DRAFT_70944 [Lepidopterella palustris CBS 459.81]